MNAQRSLVLTIVALLSVAPLLAACNTTAGVGQDVSAAGDALEKSAKKHAP